MTSASEIRLKAAKLWRPPGSVSLLLWVLAYAGLAFTILAMASIGILVAPFTLIFFLAAMAFAHFWPEAPFGALIGAGLMLLFVAFRNRDYVPCPTEPLGYDPSRTSFHCGGFDPLPWLIIGIVLTGAGALGYILFRVFKKAG